MRKVRIAILILIVPLLVSCLGVKMQTKFNADGSGDLTMTLRISRALLSMGDSEDSGVPVPLSKEDLEKSFQDTPGVKVVDVTQTEDDKDRIITATLHFDNFNDLAKQGGFPGEGATISKVNGHTVFKMMVGPTPEESPAMLEEIENGGAGGQAPASGGNETASSGATGANTTKSGAATTDTTGSDATAATSSSDADQAKMEEAMQQMILSFMEGYEVEYAVTAPNEIISHTSGELSNNKRTVTLKMPMGDFYQIKKPYDFEVVW